VTRHSWQMGHRAFYVEFDDNHVALYKSHLVTVSDPHPFISRLLDWVWP